MKIEFNCPECKTLMRLAAENAGKQARCPVCTTISQIPVDAQPVTSETAKPSSLDSAFNVPARGPSDDGDVSNLGSPIKRLESSTFVGLDTNILYAIGLGGASICSNFVCCGPFVGLPVAIVGLSYTFVSKSELRQSGFVMNGLGFLLNAAILVWRYL